MFCYIEINNQGREFVNKVSDNLNEMTGTREQITWAYHPQSNDLIESQNRAIKNVLEKALDEKKTLINGHIIWRVSYLQHRVSRHSSTKYHFISCTTENQYYLLICKCGPVDLSEPFDQDIFEAVLSIANAMSD